MKSKWALLSAICGGFYLALAVSDINAAQPPKPYTAVKASRSEFRCLGRITQLGSMLLPKQIVAANQRLLAAPVSIVTEPDILSDLKGKSSVTENVGDKATWEWAGESARIRAIARMTGECDGFCWYEINLVPKQPIRLSAIRLEIPRIAGTARYLNTAKFSWPNVATGLAEKGGAWSGKFAPYVWLGDGERGLAWCAESDRGWSLNQPDIALEVKTKGGVVLFHANLLDHEELISEPVTIRFGLQASPVKPVSFAWRAQARIMHDVTYDACLPRSAGGQHAGYYPGEFPSDSSQRGHENDSLLDQIKAEGVKTVVFHQTWTEYYGQLTPVDDRRMRQLIGECHKRGIKLLVYVGYGLAQNAPELQGHHDNWSVLPLITWKTKVRPEFERFDATCPRSGWADWLVTGIDRLFSEYELDGIYFDGTSEAWECRNLDHGCGWKDEQGRVHSEYAILAARQMMRRIADTVHKHRPDAILDVHMSASLTLPTLSFCDSYWDGEQFQHLTVNDKFELPLHMFRAEFMGYAQGLDAEFLCYAGHPFTLDEAIALAWLHGVEVRPFPSTLPVISQIWRVMDDFGTDSAAWLPYWNGSGAIADDNSIKASSYTKRGKVLLFVSHLKRDSSSCNLRLDRRRLGLAAGRLTAVDPLTGTKVALDGDTIPLTFEGMTCRLIEIHDKHW